MAGKNEKWVMFRNFMVNELGITKEEIREWINDAVQEEAKKMVAESFERKNPEQMIKDAIYHSSIFMNPTGFNNTVIEKTAKILAENIQLTIKK